MEESLHHNLSQDKDGRGDPSGLEELSTAAESSSGPSDVSSMVSSASGSQDSKLARVAMQLMKLKSAMDEGRSQKNFPKDDGKTDANESLSMKPHVDTSTGPSGQPVHGPQIPNSIKPCGEALADIVKVLKNRSTSKSGHSETPEKPDVPELPLKPEGNPYVLPSYVSWL